MKLGIREIFFGLLLLGVLVGSYVLGFARLAQQQTLLRNDIDTKQKTLDALRDTTAAATAVAVQLDSLSNSLDFFDQRIPRQKDVDRILEEIWRIADTNNLITKSVRPMRVERGPRCAEQPIELLFEGYYPGFRAFLTQLEQLDRITRVTSMQLLKVDDPLKPMEVKMTLIIFFEPDSPAAGASGG